MPILDSTNNRRADSWPERFPDKRLLPIIATTPSLIGVTITADGRSLAVREAQDDMAAD